MSRLLFLIAVLLALSGCHFDTSGAPRDAVLSDARIADQDTTREAAPPPDLVDGPPVSDGPKADGQDACIDGDAPVGDGTPVDSPPIDTSQLDGLPSDAPLPDASLPDAPLPDAPLPDAPLPDAPLPDAPLPDAPLPDAPLPDAPLPDAGGCLAGGEVTLELQGFESSSLPSGWTTQLANGNEQVYTVTWPTYAGNRSLYFDPTGGSCNTSYPQNDMRLISPVYTLPPGCSAVRVKLVYRNDGNELSADEFWLDTRPQGGTWTARQEMFSLWSATWSPVNVKLSVSQSFQLRLRHLNQCDNDNLNADALEVIAAP